MAAPTAPNERILTLDILRGFALFGVLWSNLNGSYKPTTPGGITDHVLSAIQWGLVSRRFYTILGFLFGIGFALQLIRAESRGEGISLTYMRRLGALLLVGVLHGLFIWRGDILTLYATAGFALLLFRGLSPRGLLLAAVATFFLLPLIGFAVEANWHLVSVPPPDHSYADAVYAHGTFAIVARQRIADYVASYAENGITAIPAFLTLFILGLWLGRIGFVQQLPNRLGVIRRALFIALLFAAIGKFLDRSFALWWPGAPEPPSTLGELAVQIPRFEIGLAVAYLTRWSMATVLVCAVTLFAHRGQWKSRLNPLASVGRMPLTTYLTQSLVCTFLFYGYGLGWYGTVSYTGMFVITVVLFSAQMAASSWWLRRYRFGPSEWLWRTTAYGARQPMRV